MLVIRNLNASTKYYVRVLASTKVGRGNYSKITGKSITNGSKFFILALGKNYYNIRRDLKITNIYN